jgi:hypothetical protein
VYQKDGVKNPKFLIYIKRRQIIPSSFQTAFTQPSQYNTHHFHLVKSIQEAATWKYFLKYILEDRATVLLDWTHTKN